MKCLPLAAVIFLLAGPLLAQSPQDVVSELLRQHQIELRQQFQDQQKQRQLDQQRAQQEQANDRAFCVGTNSERPNVERCIRALAEMRRSGIHDPPSQPDGPIDYSKYATPVPDSPRKAPSQAPPSRADVPLTNADVPLTNKAGVFAVPVEINGAITLEFAVDSGATDVIIPLDVFSTLKRTGTIKDFGHLGRKNIRLGRWFKIPISYIWNSIAKGRR